MQQTGGEDETGRRKRREGKKREGGERGREGKVKGQWVTTGAVERLTEARVFAMAANEGGDGKFSFVFQILVVVHVRNSPCTFVVPYLYSTVRII